jgi:hypothetical protein
MWQVSGNHTRPPVVEAVEAIIEMIKAKCISGGKDEVGLMFFGTVSLLLRRDVNLVKAESKNALNWPHISTVHEIEQPGAELIKDLQGLVDKGTQAQWSQRFGGAFVDYGPPPDHVTLSNVFLTASRTFQSQ